MVTYPNGLQSQFTYDDLNRLTKMNGYQYQRGPTGNRTGANEPSGRTLGWQYDGIYRLTQETISSDPHSVNGSVSYGLDPVGNRLSQTSSLAGIGSGSYTYDADDRMLATETYDNNGNTLVTGARTFTYDFENRLKTMTMGGNTATIVCDADGNRVAKTANGVTTRYLVDDLNPTGYAQVVEELTAGVVTRQYTYGLQRINQNQLITNSWTPSFYGYDGFGSVRTLTDSTGTVTDTCDYDAWGNTVNTTGSTPNVYLYRGEQYDPDLRLYYLRARYLNPLCGRFLTRDPAAGHIKVPSSLHKYLYVGGDPVSWIDPSGRNALIEYLTPMRIVAITALLLVVNAMIIEAWCENNEMLKLASEAAESKETGKGATVRPALRPCQVPHEELPPPGLPVPPRPPKHGPPGDPLFPPDPEPIEF